MSRNLNNDKSSKEGYNSVVNIITNDNGSNWNMSLSDKSGNINNKTISQLASPTHIKIHRRNN